MIGMLIGSLEFTHESWMNGTKSFLKSIEYGLVNEYDFKGIS
jgi:hypothetical protein